MGVVGVAAITDSDSLTMIAFCASLCGASDDIFVVSFLLSDCTECQIWIPTSFPFDTHFAITSSTIRHWFWWMLLHWCLNRWDCSPPAKVPRLVLHSMSESMFAEEANTTTTWMEWFLSHKGRPLLVVFTEVTAIDAGLFPIFDLGPICHMGLCEFATTPTKNTFTRLTLKSALTIAAPI